MRLRLTFIVMLLSWLIGTATAVEIQYVLPVSNGAVSGVSDETIEAVAGYGVVTMIGTADQIIWPVPSGCSVGMPEWSRVSDPNIVALDGTGLAMRPGLLFFSTSSPLLLGCHPVSSWHALKTLVRNTLITTLPDGDIIAALNYYWGWYYARCDDAPTNQNCIDWKANLTIMLNMYPGRGQGITESAKAADLVSDAMTFRDQQCKNTPGGPFCP